MQWPLRLLSVLALSGILVLLGFLILVLWKNRRWPRDFEYTDQLGRPYGRLKQPRK